MSPPRNAVKILALRTLAGVILPVLVLAIVFGVAGYPVYVRPQTDPPRPADAILVLGGTASAERYLLGLELAHQGFADDLVLSDPYRPTDPVLDGICARPQRNVTVTCFDPDPPTTLGEGRELRRLASENGWRTVIVVTSVSHISRARYILDQCFDGELVMVPASQRLSPFGWAWIYVYQSAGYAKALLQRGC
nr:YdcF family protein [Mycolicibacterium mengxianglii]